jgi:hypothetical protein
MNSGVRPYSGKLGLGIRLQTNSSFAIAESILTAYDRIKIRMAKRILAGTSDKWTLALGGFDAKRVCTLNTITQLKKLEVYEHQCFWFCPRKWSRNSIRRFKKPF